MKSQEIVGFALIGALVGCSGSAEQAPTPTPTPTSHNLTSEHTNLSFLKDGKDSDYVQKVNCAQNPNAKATVDLTDPEGDIVILTMGVTEQDPKTPQATVKFIGGVTIYAVGDEHYKLAASNMVEVVDMHAFSQKDSEFEYSPVIHLKDNLVAEVILTQDTATIECHTKGTVVRNSN